MPDTLYKRNSPLAQAGIQRYISMITSSSTLVTRPKSPGRIFLILCPKALHTVNLQGSYERNLLLKYKSSEGACIRHSHLILEMCSKCYVFRNFGTQNNPSALNCVPASPSIDWLAVDGTVGSTESDLYWAFRCSVLVHLEQCPQRYCCQATLGRELRFSDEVMAAVHD